MVWMQLGIKLGVAEMKIKNENIFTRLSSGAEPCDEGRFQFYLHQSKGIAPDQPNPYFIRLCRGKQEFDRLSSEYYQMFCNGDWWGFYTLWLDWEGDRWIIPHLCQWYRGIPAWVTEEDYQKAEDSMWEEHVKNLGEKFRVMMSEGLA